MAPKVLIMKKKSTLVALFFGATSFINSLTNNTLFATPSVFSDRDGGLNDRPGVVAFAVGLWVMASED